MKNKYLLVVSLLSLLSILCLTGCSNKVKNNEYNDYYKKVSKIIKDFDNASKISTFNKKNKITLKKVADRNDDIISIIDNTDGKKQSPDIANAFEQSFYIPIIMGKGLTEYRKQTSFYNITAFVDEQYYIKTFLENESISTYVYIPGEYSFDGVNRYIYFSVNYIDDNNYTFGGIEISDDNNTEWYFYGDSSLLFIEYWKTTERAVINYQSANMVQKEINDQNVISEVRNKLNDSFSLINKNTFKNLKNESKFEITKQEYLKIMNELFPDSGGISVNQGLQVSNGVALGYISDGSETKITLPSNATAISNSFYIFANGNIRELYIPKSITRISDQEGNTVDIQTFNIDYFNDNDYYYLENIIIEEGSTLFKVENNLLTDITNTTLLYVTSKKVDNLDLLQYNKYSDWFFRNQLPDIFTNLKSLKYNLIYDENNREFDIFANIFLSSDIQAHFEYLEVGNVYDQYNFSILNDKVNIDKLVLNGTFDEVYISDENGAIKNIELNSTNPNATFAGFVNGLETIDIYFNNNLDNLSPINCLNAKNIVVHEGVTEFSLNQFEIDYNLDRTINIYLPSTLNRIYYDRLQYNAATKIKLISKVNNTVFTDFSNIKRYGCEIEIEDNSELNSIINDYEYVGYGYNKETGEIDDGSIRLINYCGNSEELFVPATINGKAVTDFTISSRSEINSEPMKNTKTLKKLHLPNTLKSFVVSQDYFVDGTDYSDERNYHLDTVYYDGTLEEFRNKFDITNSLFDRKFCKEIVCSDQTLKSEEDKPIVNKNYNDLTIELENGEQLIFTNVYVKCKDKSYSLHFNIYEKDYVIELNDKGEYYIGITQYDKIDLMEFTYNSKEEKLTVRFTLYNVEYTKNF